MSRSAVWAGVIRDKNVRSVTNMWFWGFWVYVECVKVAFQCVHVVFWVFLRWECLLEGVVVLGVTGILPSLLREDSFCMCNVAQVRLTLWLFHVSKNSGSSKTLKWVTEGLQTLDSGLWTGSWGTCICNIQVKKPGYILDVGYASSGILIKYPYHLNSAH